MQTDGHKMISSSATWIGAGLLLAVVVAAAVLYFVVERNSSPFRIDKPAGTYFYRRFYTNYTHPFKVEESDSLAAEEARNQPGYCAVSIDDQGRVVRFEKYQDGKRVLSFAYAYDQQGKLSLVSKEP